MSNLLDALDPDQREVATTLKGPVCVLAGAGTGKTRAITHRIAYGVHTGVYQPTSVLAVTFTARAAGEMRSRLRSLGVSGVQARTFHAAALRQLGFFWPQVIGGPVPTIVEQKGQLVAHVAANLGLDVDRFIVRDLAAEIEWAKVSMIAPEDYSRRAAGRELPGDIDHTTMVRIMTAYEDATRERGVIDFEDVLLHMGSFLADYPDVARQVRSQYRRFVVDEFQDVSPLQNFVLSGWLGDSSELCVVGDPNQTIYSFAGATASYLLDFRKQFPDAVTIQLVSDYRSTPQVVDLANRVIASGRRRGESELIPMRPAGPPVTFDSYDDDESEAHGIAAKIGRLIAAGVPASSIAILYRTNVQSEAFESALTDAGIGYLVKGGERFFSRPEIRRLLVLLRGASRVADLNLSMVEQVQDLATAVGWTPEPPTQRGSVRDRWDGLQAVINLAADLVDDAPEATLADLLADLDERAAAQHAPTVEGVTLATLHAAKGLEWEAVFLVGLSEGLLPINAATTPDALAEERRLLYVGITRAHEHLHLSYARSRTGRGNRKVSRFLANVWPASSRRAPTGRGRTSRRLTGDADPELFEKLRTWRLERSSSLERPAYTVMVDATMAEIAEVQPTSLAELGTIKGIGPSKLTAFGADIVDIVTSHRQSQERLAQDPARKTSGK